MGEQTSVEEVDGLVQFVVVCVQVALAFQQQSLTLHTLLPEYLYGIFYGTLYAMYGHVGLHYLLHTMLYAFHVVLCYRAVDV